ncbi:ATP-dependent DNA helicase [Trichonephila clavipes]|nr:ATP-dependent DNA helicase [Trichonephila clavipes]
MAFSGIVVTLLDGGQTERSALMPPLDIHKKPNAMCTIERKSGLATVLQRSSIIIKYMRCMAHKHSSNPYKELCKIFNGHKEVFGVAVVLLSGDLKQTSPVNSSLYFCPRG